MARARPLYDKDENLPEAYQPGDHRYKSGTALPNTYAKVSKVYFVYVTPTVDDYKQPRRSTGRDPAEGVDPFRYVYYYAPALRCSLRSLRHGSSLLFIFHPAVDLAGGCFLSGRPGRA